MKPTIAIPALLLFLSGASVAQETTIGSIPTDLLRKRTSGTIRRGFQKGSINTDAIARTVQVEWTASANTNSTSPPNPSLKWDLANNAVGTAVYNNGSQAFSVRYWPTDVAVVSDSELIVCGFSPNGNTMVARWNLSWPTMPSVSVDASTGLSSVPVVLPSIVSRKILYNDGIAGRTIVRNACALSQQDGSVTNIVVQFDDSSDIYVLNLESGQFTLIASPSSAGGPSLGEFISLQGSCFTSLTLRDHPTWGKMYFFSRLYSPGDKATGLNLAPVLLDTDRDGSLDSVFELTPPQYEELGLDQLRSYNDWWLL